MTRILDSDSLTQTHTLFHPSDDGNTYVIESKQDAENLVEANKLLFNDFDERTGYAGDGLHRMASIPLVVYFDLKRRGIVDDDKAFRRWLDDPDNAAFRTRPGKMSR